MVVLVVDTDAFLEAGECSRSVAAHLRGAVSRAGSGLAGSGQMAGSDEHGLRWAGGYDAACGSLLTSVTQWLDAVSHLAWRLTATGCYYEVTEWANAGVTDIQVELPPAVAPASCPYIPSAAGGARRFPNAGNPAFEWVVEQIANLVGDVWPDGDTHKLDQASTVWHRLADDLDDAGAGLTRTTDALQGITAPEIPTIHDDIQRLRSYATRLASACRTLGTACTDLSGQITYVHLQTEITIGITVAAIAVTVAAGAGLTPLTFGISDVAAAGGVAAEVGGAVATITGFITELASSISVGVGMIAESAAALLPISTELATSIGVTLGDLTATTVLWGTAGATENIAITAITQPDTDLLTAAETGFITWGTGGALGRGAVQILGSSSDASLLRTGANASGSGLRPEARASIVAMAKGSRPDPTTYLSPAYIASHLAKFEGGATRFMSEQQLAKYGIGQSDQTSFVMARIEVEKLIRRANGSKRVLENELGLKPGSLDGNVVRIDIPEPLAHGGRIPSGNEAGANDQWQPAGELPNGVPEIVIDARGMVPGPDYYAVRFEMGDTVATR